MNINDDGGNETQIESEFNKLNISINHENCYQPPKNYGVKNVPSCIIEGLIEGRSSVILLFESNCKQMT